MGSIGGSALDNFLLNHHDCATCRQRHRGYAWMGLPEMNLKEQVYAEPVFTVIDKIPIMRPEKRQIRSCRVRITGKYQGKPFVYEDPPGREGYGFGWNELDGEGRLTQSEYWWDEGNMSCDCNRAMFVDPELELPCGHDQVHIDRIEPIEDAGIAPLILNESGDREDD
jgi:hypothetical protein